MARATARFLTLGLAAMVVAAGCATGTPSTTAPPSVGAPSAAPPASDAPASQATGEWVPEYVDGKLQPLPDGFPNQPITITVVDLPGSSDGVFARHLQTSLRDISPVSVEIEDLGDQGSFPTWEAIQYTLGQPGGPEGYWPIIHVVPGLVIDTLVVDLAGELGMSLDDVQFVNVMETTPFVMTTRKGAPWGKSWDDFLEYCLAHPGEVKYISRSPGSTGYIAMERMQILTGCELDQRVGGSHDENQAALGAGEADVSMTQVTNALTHYDAGVIDLLLVTGEDRVGAPWADVKSFAEAGMEGEPWAQNRGFLIPGAADETHRLWLAELFKAAAADPEYQASRQGLPGLVLKDPHLNREETDALAAKAIADAEPVVRELNLHYDQQ